MTAPLPSDPRGPARPELRAAVTRAVDGLDRLDDRPLAEHVAAFERVHAALGDALADRSAGGTDAARSV